MTEFPSKEERIARGNEAARMLSDGSVFNQAVEEVRKAQVEEMLTGATVEEREQARAVVLGLGAIAKQLVVYVGDAAVAQASLKG
jgi:hypothetical protein